MIVAMTENGTPASSIRVHPVCLRSWNRQDTPARIFAVSQASFQRPIGLVGSLSYTTVAPSPEAPYRSAGKTKWPGSRSGNRLAQKPRIATARSFKGRRRPVPDSVLLWPTVSVQELRSTCPQQSRRSSEYRIQVLRATKTAGYSDRERLARHASNNASSSSRLMARPTSSRARSIRTSGCIDAQRRFFRRIARNVPTSRLTVLGAAPCSMRFA